MKPDAPVALSRRGLLTGGLALGAGLLLPTRLWALAPSQRLLRLRDPESERVLNDAVAGGDWWGGASVWRFSDQNYDEIRLRPQNDGGYLTFITGEGKEDFTPEQVVTTVWKHQDKLDNHMAGCVIAEPMARGTDPVLGNEYVDLFMLADLSVFYGAFFQRMYKYELQDGRTLLAFEKLTPEMAGAEAWQRYQALRGAAIARETDKGELRSIFNNIIEVTDTYGVFITEPGKQHTTRITLIAKIGFGDGTGFFAQVGSKMPPVIKSGLRAGFDGSVAIARSVKSGRYR